jgi:hypothetical protein
MKGVVVDDLTVAQVDDATSALLHHLAAASTGSVKGAITLEVWFDDPSMGADKRGRSGTADAYLTVCLRFRHEALSVATLTEFVAAAGKVNLARRSV